MWGKEGFSDSPYLTDGAAEWLIKLKARIAGYDFGIDYIEREFFRKGYADTKDFVVHLKLLQAEVLNLENLFDVTDAGIVQLAALQLESIKLDGTKITDASATTLAGFTQLKRLDLFNTQVTDRTLESAANWKTLESLRIWGTRITDDCVDDSSCNNDE